MACRTTACSASTRRACAATAAASTKACCTTSTDAWRRPQGTQVLVLHQLGNHGPSYFRRYPAAFARFTPACENDDLQHCTREQIVNAYDNALLYTDHVLAQLIARLQAHADSVDSAMLYVSDHGESLGENRLFLHGMPYAIAPARADPGADADVGVAGLRANDRPRSRLPASACALEPASHDHLFHTMLGLLDVQTALYEPQWDFSATCRREVVAAAP